MLPDKFMQVIQHEGVVAIATQGQEGPHLVNSWNSYLQITPSEHLLIPAGRMNRTEANLSKDNRVLLTVGAREVPGERGTPGAGFLINGTGEFISAGDEFESVKKKFPWARAVLKVQVGKVTQTL
jgi:hypothetical protein